MWLAAVLAVGASASDAAPAVNVDEQLKQNTREMLAAVAPGRWDVWDRYLDDAVLYTAEDGRTLTKAQLRAEFQPLPPGYSGTIELAEAVVRVDGDTAVVSHEDVEHEEVYGQKLVSRYHTTDTWRRRDGGWRLIAAQVLARLDDPPPASVDPKVYDAYVGLGMCPSIPIAALEHIPDGNMRRT